jgi:hypothetical protein
MSCDGCDELSARQLNGSSCLLRLGLGFKASLHMQSTRPITATKVPTNRGITTLHRQTETVCNSGSIQNSKNVDTQVCFGLWY